MMYWLSTLFEKGTAWCPRFEKITPTDRLIKWSRCREGTIHGPGIIWYWPLVSEVERCDIRWKSMMTSVQTITIADGTPVSARTLTRWRPEDPLHCVTSEEDYADTVAETAQSVLVSVLGSCTTDTIKHCEALNLALTIEMREVLSEIGVGVKAAKFTELCVSPAFRIINDGS